MMPLTSTTSRQLDVATAACLAVGAGLGMAGTFASQAPLRQLLWAIDETSLIVATALLTIRFLRLGSDLVATGFLVFAIGEALQLAGSGAGLEGGRAAFAGGVALWAAALLLVSIPAVFPLWARGSGLIAAALFAFVALRMAWGVPIVAVSKPLPFFAYPFFALTIVGWIVTVLRGSGSTATSG
jgi:hypothetical protein